MNWRSAARSLLAGAVLTGTVVVVQASAAPAIVSCGAASPTCQPVAVNDSYTVRFTVKPVRVKFTAAVGLLANDQAPTGVNSVVDTNCSCNSTTFGGVVTLGPDGSFSYTPPPSFTGFDRFQYSITDGHGRDVSTATVRLIVTPVIANDSFVTAYNSALTVNAPGVFANDIRASFDLILSNTNAVHGDVVLKPDGSLTYVPDQNYSGSDAFTYTVFDLDFDATYTASVHLTVLGPIPIKPPPPPKPTGYWMVGQSGTVYPFGHVRQYGNASATNVTHIEPTPTRRGYWVLDRTGHAFAFGDAPALGGTGSLKAGEIASSLSSTPTGKGYWIFTNRGRVFTRGDAKAFGDMSHTVLNGPIVGSIPTPTGKGYYMVGSDGGIFAFGNAGFHGSMGGTHLNKPVIGIVRYGNGYLMVSSDGGIFAFSNLPFLGSLGSNPPAVPIVGVASGG